MVKNRRKNGDHYWVDAFVTPILEGGKAVEYQSVRTLPRPEFVARADALYHQLLAGKTPSVLRGGSFGLRTRLFAAVAFAIVLAAAAALLAGAVSPLGALLFTVVGTVGAGTAIGYLLAPLAALAAQARTRFDNATAAWIYTGRTDEVGQIALALKMLESETGAVVGRISDSAKRLSASAEHLAATVEENSAGTRRQQGETDQVATAITEMAASVEEVARNAQQTADAAGRADGDARSGTGVVARTRETIRTLASEIEQASHAIPALNTQATEITSILEVIRSIAEQTNLLALNAAIEAARAGEHGRGFAVVADEVRTLASRTQKATREINGMIERLQAGAETAVGVMERSRAGADLSVAEAQHAAESLEAIVRAVAVINDMTTQIATAVQEQSHVSEEISRSVATIRQVADGTAESALRSSDSSNEVASMAERLQQLAHQFWARKRA